VKAGIASAATAPILKKGDLAPISDYAGSLAFRTLAVNVSAQNRFFQRYHLIPPLAHHF
jgi:hypothetical protein